MAKLLGSRLPAAVLSVLAAEADGTGKKPTRHQIHGCEDDGVEHLHSGRQPRHQ
jgi:ribosomal protein L4